MHEILWGQLGLCIGAATAVGVVIFHAVSGYYHLRYYRRRRQDPASWKCQPRRFLTPKLHRMSVIAGTLNMSLGGVITGVLIYCYTQGLIYAPIYTEVGEYGWTYTILSTIGLFVALDAFAYYIHRALHFKFLYKRVHRFHHRFVATSPYVAGALHPVELLSLQASSFLPLFFIPFHAVGIGIVLVYILVFNIIDHSGVRLVSALPWQGPSTYHDDHHAHFHVNFGQHLMIWDRIHGTLRRQGRTYGKEVFGGRGRSGEGPADGDRGNLEPFVNY